MLETTVTVTQEETNDLSAVGEKSTKKVLLDQSLGVVDEEEIDLDRVEVCLLSLKETQLLFHMLQYLMVFLSDLSAILLLRIDFEFLGLL